MDFLFAEIWNIRLYLQFYFLKLIINVLFFTMVLKIWDESLKKP